MDVLNVIAQIIVVIAALIWVVLQFVWNTLIFVWETTRDYTPIVTKKVGRYLQKVMDYLKRGYAWTREVGFFWCIQAFAQVRTRLLARIPSIQKASESSLEPEIQVSPLGMVVEKVETSQEEVSLVHNAQVATLTHSVANSVSSFFEPLPELKGNAVSAITSGVLSFAGFGIQVTTRLLSFILYIAQFIIQFALYLGAVVLSIVLEVLNKLVGLRQHAPSANDTFSFFARLFSRFERNRQVKPAQVNAVLAPEFVLEMSGGEVTQKPLIPARLFSRISFIGMVSTAILLLGLLFPDIALKILPYRTEPIQSAVNASVLGGSFDDGNLYSAVKLPERNEYLPEGNWISIPKIGVMTQIHEETMEDHEEALKKGVWRVPEFADPTQGKEYPTILVAHKYGYLRWSNQYRRQNSFYNLEKLEIGDTFEVIWDKRKFVYEIYAGEEGKDITDYDADVVLYTCKHLNSPIRIFRYARRVEY